MTDQKPPSVRVAEALGCKPAFKRNFDGYAWYCTCAARDHGHEFHNKLWPYGEDSPEGWACTGPLIEQFGLELEKNTRTKLWACAQSRYDTTSPSRIIVQQPTACAAVAEWVAQHGAQAVAEDAATSARRSK